MQTNEKQQLIMYTGHAIHVPVKQVDSSLSFRSYSTKQQLSTLFKCSSSPPGTPTSPSAPPFSPNITTEQEGSYILDQLVDHSSSFGSSCIKQQVSTSIESDSISSSPPGTSTSLSAQSSSPVTANEQDRIHTLSGLYFFLFYERAAQCIL